MNEMITISREEYEQLRTAAQDLADLIAFERAKTEIVAGSEELIPSEYANRIIDGENPLRVYRDLRGLTQAALAAAAGVNRIQIAEIEANRKSGSVQTLRKLADALSVTLDDLA